MRFTPVGYEDTPFYVSELVERYGIERYGDRHHRVLLVGLFVLDFLVIHPFVDGNGRVSRLLASHLLSDAGYGVGRYVSIESLTYARRDDYYEALAASASGWHESAHDPWPWLKLFVETVAEAYEAFAERAADHRSGATKQDRVRNWALNHAGDSFEMADVWRAVPGVSDQTARLVLREMKNEGLVSPSGVGRGTRWTRAGASFGGSAAGAGRASGRVARQVAYSG